MQSIFFHTFRKRFLSLVIISFFGIMLFLSIFQCQKKAARDNFILITLDTQRADFISSYSPDNALTPNIDFISQEGILYENCFSLTPITLPSHASIFFSEHPNKIKNYNNGQVIRKKRIRPSFVNIFRKEGFQTAAFVSLGVLESQFGLNEGFTLYKDDFPEGRWYLSAEEVNRNVFSWLDMNKDHEFFLWIHYSDPHDPYSPPDLPPDFKLYLNDKLLDEYCLNKYIKYKRDINLRKGKNRLKFELTNSYINDPNKDRAILDILEFSPKPDGKDIQVSFVSGWSKQIKREAVILEKVGIIDIVNHEGPRRIKLTFRGRPILPPEAIRELYKREVEYLDGEIGRFWNKLKELKLLGNTHILIAGDHGEGLGEYNAHPGVPHIGHIHFLYNIYMKVPLIIYSPRDSKKGMRIDEPVTLLDIAPTIMHIMGFEHLPHFQGRDLLHLKSENKFMIFEETYKPEALWDKFALLQFPWHLILTPEQKRYELFNLEENIEENENIYNEETLPEEVAKLKQKLDSFVSEVLKGKEEIKIDKKTKEMLRALGYIK